MAISVFLKDLPNMMRGLISEAIEAEPDMRLMGDIEAIVAVLPQSAPDAVILGSSGVEASLDKVAPILERWPASVVVAIETRAQHSSFYELQPRRVALGEIATPDLVRLIRKKAAASDTESGAVASTAREIPDA